MKNVVTPEFSRARTEAGTTAPAAGTGMALRTRSAGASWELPYPGITTATRCPMRASSRGREPTTSARPPVLAQGLDSEENMRIRGSIGKVRGRFDGKLRFSITSVLKQLLLLAVLAICGIFSRAQAAES